MMNTNGNSGPANTGPLPLLANLVTASFSSTGMVSRMPAASRPMVPTFMKVDR